MAAKPSDGDASHATPPSAVNLQHVIDQLRTPWPDNRIVNIVWHGHSALAGCFQIPDVCIFDSYPNLLHVKLKKRFPCAIINVIVTAVGGEDAERGAARFDQHVMRFRPRYCQDRLCSE
ncbi:MAG: hypothetical protein WD851_04525 [Pirellulales bacterium]